MSPSRKDVQRPAPGVPIARRAFVTHSLGAMALTVPALRGLRWARGMSGPRIAIVPAAPTRSVEPGEHPLGLGAERDGRVYVPKLAAGARAPLFVALHGATQAGDLMTARLAPLAERVGCVIVAPDSRGVTWDAIRGEFEADPAFIGRAIAWAFDRVAIDASRLWIGGFSDGASYALSLGIANGDRFPRVLAFSPGFVIPVARAGSPEFFVSHGRQDTILPIDRCGRVVVAELRTQGYRVRFDEFEGGHRMPPEIVDAAAGWLRG